MLIYSCIKGAKNILEESIVQKLLWMILGIIGFGEHGLWNEFALIGILNAVAEKIDSWFGIE